MVCGLDLLLSAVSLTRNLLTIGFALIAPFQVILAYAKLMADFLMHRPALKILLTTRATCLPEGLQQQAAKAVTYRPLGFALGRGFLGMRQGENRGRSKGMRGEGIEPPTNSV